VSATKATPSTGGYEFTCVCGAKFFVAEPKGRYWDCNREYELDWQAKYVPPAKGKA
jgi:hypothetical protein